MRLSCPNCGTRYDVPDSALPAAGQHVQCTQCHTRWFARGPEPATRLTEEQILARLETRKPLTLVSGGRQRTAEPAAEASAEPSAGAARGFVWEGLVHPAPTVAAPVAEEEPPLETEPATPAQKTEPAPGPEPRLEPPQARDEALSPRTAEAAGLRRFAAGLLVALVLAALALAVYLVAEVVTAQVPSAAPLIGSYAEAVNEAREGLEAAVAPLRD